MTSIGQCQQHFHYPVEKIAISCEGTIGQILPSWLRGSVAREDLLKYLQDKYDWHSATADLIDWQSYEAAHRRLPYFQQTTMVKYRSRWLEA